MRIAQPARRHGVSDPDIWHAVRYAVREFERGDLLMLIGPDRTGALLEVGVLDAESDDPVIIHAMALRRTFYRYL